MENRKRLAYSIIQYLHDQLQHGGLPPEARESLEASIQCLETAFEVAVEDEGLAVAQTLPEMFRTFTGAEAVPPLCGRSPPIPHCGPAVPEAERLKAAGNEQMKRDNFEAAVSFYGRAIALNPANAVYFCNRAAAYSSLGNHAGAVEDCRRAIAIDPYYGKAYGRMGLALAGLKRHREAAACYRKALTLDPDNATYRASLSVAERRMQELPPGGASVGCNLAGLLNHSSFRSVASSLLNNPQIRQIMCGVMAGGHPAAGAARAGSAPSGGPGFVPRGRPELGEQLRSPARSWTPGAGKHKQE